ncbi:MAG: DNA polymerase III subunit gamma/tau [Rhodospirillaceae bacterium]|nr:DNA polymerase III subunit gamma/tau [Rhodospirillaceae bacterium]MDE0618654.1 DNA polymerase III subunit gamma/tau [Rhodospirillaceae bacterium]
MADSPEPAETVPPQDGPEYRVLARKYRPATFDELIGQDVLVRTLTNAIRLNRVHHAFILTGVRGIGKTTTARLIARALNCVGPDGTGGPTIEPCGVCVHCVAIAEDRDVDVLEMDAASNTGVDDVREIIDSARYRPVAAKFKIYIIDEVHMLSRNAFNALLKTLEEPPKHVKFVFATTEIRKVPVTILSRCQRFDLRRLDEAELAAHLADIAGRERAAVSDEAIALLARAADGSVRDGLSLLDRVIAQTNVGPGGEPDGEPDGASDGAAGPVTAGRVRALLGMADRSQSLDLFERIAAGDAPGAIDRAAGMYRDGAAPLLIVQDLMDIAHWLTRLKLTPDAAASGAGATATDAQRAAALSGRLQMGALSRAWQMLLKGAGEVQLAPQPMTALEMLIVRLCYAAELPTPADLVQRLDNRTGPEAAAASRPAPAAPAAGNGAAPSAPDRTGSAAGEPPLPERAAPPPEETRPEETPPEDSLSGEALPAPVRPADAPPGPGLQDAPPDPPSDMPAGAGGPPAATLARAAGGGPEIAAEASVPAPSRPPDAVDATPAAPPADFRALVDLFRERKEMILYGQLYNSVHPVSFDAGMLEIRPEAGAGRELSGRVAALLQEWTGERWIVAVSDAPGAPTLKQQDAAARQQLMDEAAQDPLVRTVLDRFEGSVLTNVSGPMSGPVSDSVSDSGQGDRTDPEGDAA